jgi:hypothetical protein
MLAGGGVGVFFGFLSATLYSFYGAAELYYDHIGMFVGGVSGLLAGGFWCYVMYRKHSLVVEMGVFNPGVLLGWGVLAGMAAGIASALLVHGVLILISLEQLDFEDIASLLFTGIVFGLVAGVVTGLICSSVWLAVVRARPVFNMGESNDDSV